MTSAFQWGNTDGAIVESTRIVDQHETVFRCVVATHA
jgi:hypothetical protein